jgi:formylglycine-generating enzyme required for sulfatase activity/class 3 adenylate cyclase
MNAPGSSRHQAQLEAFGRQHLTGLITLLFTDMVDSTALKQRLGRQSLEIFDRHHQLVREGLARFPNAQEVECAGDSFFLIFAVPSDAVEYALLLQSKLRGMFQAAGIQAQDRIGVHVGEVVIQKGDRPSPGFFGIQVDTCSRVMSLAKGGQILMTRQVFDSARQVLKGEALPGLGRLSWVSHGFYQFKGVEEPVEVCEVGEMGHGLLTTPGSSEKARRYEGVEAEPVLGWRPGVGQLIPNTQWVLEQHLGYGGFGEVWLGRHQVLKEQRVFKFCFRADRVRSLKREVTLFRLLKERIGGHPNIVGVQDVFFEEPPYYVMMEYAAAKDLASWAAGQGGIEKVPLEVRLEIVAQVADALQAAHSAGIIHRDIKPSNILIAESASRNAEQNPESGSNQKLQVKLTDFGIGQVLSDEYLAGLTRAGFTQTMVAEASTSHAGTQLYLAPELLARHPATIRSDIYALGLVLYQLLVADFRRPLTTDWTHDIKDPLLRDDLQQCFAGNPNDRFPQAGVLAQRLRSLPERHASYERRIRSERLVRQRRTIALAVAGTAGVLLLVALALAYGLHRARQGDQTKGGDNHNVRKGSAFGDKLPRYTNSLGMVFTTVPGIAARFSIWDTRVRDFRAFVKETGHNARANVLSLSPGTRKWEATGATWEDPGFPQNDLHPVCGVSWEDAQEFCQWLTEKERKEGRISPAAAYRLPRDEEWNKAAGQGTYVWGEDWPPPPMAGNFAGEEAGDQNAPVIQGYNDGYARTSPVGRFRPNANGLYDMAGNVWEWCDDWYRSKMNSEKVRKALPELPYEGNGQRCRLLRGGSWNDFRQVFLASSMHYGYLPETRTTNYGFRCVLDGTGP